ncbi:MAG: chalcone isomerase family protein [Desulforhopalus sp.]
MLGILKIVVLIIFCHPFISDSLAASIENMQLLGKGEAYYLKFFKVYDAALYSEPLAENENILDDDVSKCLHLKYSVGVDRDDFITAANTILTRQYSSEQLRQVSTELDMLHSGYKDVEKGDSYTLCYSETTETTSLAFNGGKVVSVTSPAFAEMYFSIWLGNTSPLDEKLRNNLLSKIAGTREE